MLIPSACLASIEETFSSRSTSTFGFRLANRPAKTRERCAAAGEIRLRAVPLTRSQPAETRDTCRRLNPILTQRTFVWRTTSLRTRIPCSSTQCPLRQRFPMETSGSGLWIIPGCLPLPGMRHGIVRSCLARRNSVGGWRLTGTFGQPFRANKPISAHLRPYLHLVTPFPFDAGCRQAREYPSRQWRRRALVCPRHHKSVVRPRCRTGGSAQCPRC